MIRLLAVSMLSLALAGCAQSKGALSRGASYPPSPVAITPVPSIYDTINKGVGGNAVAQTAIKNPDDPQWTGQTQVSVAARPIPPGAPGANGTVATAPAVATGSQQPTGFALGTPPAPGAPAASAAMPALANQGPSSMAADPTLAAPAAAGAPGSYPATDSRIVASGGMMNEPAGIPVGASPTTMTPAAASPAGVAASTPASAMPATLTAAPGAPGSGPRRNVDPLLGPNPDLMPAMPDLPPVKTAARPSPALAAPPAGPAGAEPGPALVPASGPAPEPNPAEIPSGSPVSPGSLVPAEPPVSLEHSTAASKPADGGLAAADLPLEAAPGPSSSPAANSRLAPAASPSPASDLRDSQVVVTAGEGPSAPPPSRTASLKESGRALARVGNEVITQHDLIAAYLEEIEKYPELRRPPPDPAAAAELAQARVVLFKQALLALIDRSVLAQEAKRHIKDKKMLELIYQDADRIFRENELPSLMRKNHVDSEARVKEKLTEQGRSLEAMRLTFREVYLAESFRYQKIKDRLKIELPDLLKYYNDHVYDHEFDRPAQITWRELVVEVDKHKSRDEARQKAELLLAKVRRGDDFTAVARNESEGPTSSRKEGGLMQTTPGSYAVKPINDALDSLPIGKLSSVIEGPESFHIVKVESRRPAGPASFEEVQDKIRPKLEAERMRKEMEAFTKKLKQNTLIEDYLEKKDPTKS
jgi:parvulin-like peptidyl-prolyl isomerase